MTRAKAMQRRQFLTGGVRVAMGLASVALVSGGVVGCGFTMRAAPHMPFKRVALVDFTPGSTIERALRTQLLQVAEVTAQPARAEVIVQALRDQRERAVVASTAAGQVREIQLRTRLVWRASTPQGRVLVEATELVLTRDMSTSESAALAKEKEAESLFVAMDEDIAQQVLRQLAKLKPGV